MLRRAGRRVAYIKGNIGHPCLAAVFKTAAAALRAVDSRWRGWLY